MRIAESQLRRIVKSLIAEGPEDTIDILEKTAEAVGEAMSQLGISKTDHIEDFAASANPENLAKKPEDSDPLGEWCWEVGKYIERYEPEDYDAILDAVDRACKKVWGEGVTDLFEGSWYDYASDKGFEDFREVEELGTCDSCGKEFPEDKLEDIDDSGYDQHLLCPKCLKEYSGDNDTRGRPENEYDIPEEMLQDLIGYVGKNYEISDQTASAIRWTLSDMGHEKLRGPETDYVYRGLKLGIEDLEALGLPKTKSRWVPGKSYVFGGNFPVRSDRTVQSWTTSKQVAAWFSSWSNPGEGNIAVVWQAPSGELGNEDKLLDLNPLYAEFGREAGATKSEEREVLALTNSNDLVRAQKIWIRVGSKPGTRTSGSAAFKGDSEDDEGDNY